MKRNIRTKIILGFAISALISSCAVGKKYVQPEMEMPSQYRNSVNLTADSVSLPWKTFFKDPNLVILIDKALNKNKDVAVALKNIQQMELMMKQAKLALLPTVDASLGVNRSYPSKNSLNGSLSEQFTGTKYIDDFNAGISVSLEADVWGKAKMQREQAQANYFAQKENLSALKTRLISQVAQAYYNLISLDRQLEIAKSNVALSDSTLELMNLQYQAGLINSLAIEQSQAQKKTAELIIPLANQNIAVQENALSILCGEYPDKVIRSKAENGYNLQSTFSTGVPANLLSRRPDVKAAEFNVRSLNAQTGLAKAAMYPTFSLTGQIGTNSFKVKSWFDLPGSLAKNLAVNIAQPIFQKGQLKTAYKSALLEQEKAVEVFKQTVLTAVGEVSDAIARSEGTAQRLELIQQRSNSLSKAVKDAMLLYNSGMATYLDVITAQSGKLQNDLEQIDIQTEQVNSLIELYRALGGGSES